jgi:glutamine synthetase
MAGDPGSPLSLAKLSQTIESGHVDTVLVVFTDMQGRLQGKRVHAEHFIREVMHGGIEACTYLLAVDVDMRTVSGYEHSSWETGYGDFVVRPDMNTLRAAPWLPGTAMVQCDLLWHDGKPVRQSPRQVLRAQVAEAQQMGVVAMASTELEFIVFNGTYQQAWESQYSNLRPATRYNVDYSILGTTDVEPLLRDIRNTMYNAGLTVESSKGECNLGQQEVTFKYDDVLKTADNHVVFKMGAKELATRHEKALTFMAKYDENEGNSCHIHMSLRGLDGSYVFAEEDPAAADHDGRSRVFRSFVAGVLATLEDFTLLYAPNVNSYKRYQPGSFAPTGIAWGNDNRTCALRVVGNGGSLRLENRVPGGDANPYLALAAMLAGGLFGIRAGLPLEPPFAGNAYESRDLTRVPTTLSEARDKFAESELAKSAFGEDVVAQYVRAADIELEESQRAVTDWERRRGFERL